jgi:hypothetical protein
LQLTPSLDWTDHPPAAAEPPGGVGHDNHHRDGGGGGGKAAAFTPWRARDPETRVNPIETRRLREGAATAADLQFVVEMLEEWLAVVGITERFEESVQLFSYVAPHAVCFLFVSCSFPPRLPSANAAHHHPAPSRRSSKPRRFVSVSRCRAAPAGTRSPAT